MYQKNYVALHFILDYNDSRKANVRVEYRRLSRMLHEERIVVLKEYMLQNRFAKINDLKDLMNVSKATVRRCLIQLENDGFLQTTRGGAVIASNGVLFEQPYYMKRDTNAAEKARIAQKACEMIGDNLSIFLDSGTTIERMCPFLSRPQNLMVATNDIQIASELKDNTNMTVTVIGGLLRKNFYTLTGMYAELILNEMRFDYAFISSDTICENGGLMITNPEEVQIKRLVAKSASKLIVLADHSKFEKTSFLSVCGLDDIDVVITDNKLDDGLYERYRELGPEIVRV